MMYGCPVCGGFSCSCPPTIAEREEPETLKMFAAAAPVKEKSYQGEYCVKSHCNKYNPYAEPNQPDGSYICYDCRN